MLEFLSNPQWTGIAGIVAIIGLLLQYGRKKVRSSARGKEKQFHYEVNDLAERFLLVYKAHGIEHTQIPQTVKKAELSLADLSSNTALLKALDENILSATCTHFGIQREWLDGGNVPIYNSLYFDKQLKEYIHFLVELKKNHLSIEGFATKCFENKLKHSEQNYDIALLFRGNIKNLSNIDEEEPIWRYYPIEDENYWGYRRTRLQLKAMIHIAFLFGIFIYGCQMTQEEIRRIREGKIFPGPLLENRSYVAWHPDEYIFCEIDDFQPHDIEEAQQVRGLVQSEFYQLLEKSEGIDLKRLQQSTQSYRKVLSC